MKQNEFHVEDNVRRSFVTVIRNRVTVREGMWSAKKTVTHAGTEWFHMFTVGPLIIESSSNHLRIAFWEKLSVYRATRGPRQAGFDPNENLIEFLSSNQSFLSQSMLVDLMESTNCRTKLQVGLIQHSQSSIITGPVVYECA